MSKKRILIIDDDASVTRSLKLDLETLGDYEVRTDTHPRKTLADARAFRPDLILLDVMMPELDGGEVAAQLQADPLLREIPIVFLTAIVSNEETGGHEMVRGSMPYLAKPVDFGELTKCIEEHVRK